MAQLVAKVQDEIAQLGVQLKLLLSATKNKWNKSKNKIKQQMIFLLIT
jgi:hypothetical protein